MAEQAEQRKTDDYWQAYWGERFKSENEGYQHRIAALEARAQAAEADADRLLEGIKSMARSCMDSTSTKWESFLTSAAEDALALHADAVRARGETA